jgi:hypothetical protein
MTGQTIFSRILPGTLCLALALLFLSWGGRPAQAFASAGTLDCPPTVLSGLPFLCAVHLDRDVEEVSLTWAGRSLFPVFGPDSGMRRAEVLLGAGLGMAGTEQAVLLRLFTGSTEERITRTVAIVPREYPEQRLSLPPHMVEPPKEALPRIHMESELVRAVLSGITPARFWTLPLVRPLEGAVISPFGFRRILNGQPRAQHRGIDLRGAEGTLVLAAGAGIVSLVDEHYFAGKSVYLDHGNGVYSMYFHLSEPLVVQDQVIRPGEPIGRVGRTGRATGPHLHFGLSVLGESVDPMPLFP